jgi:GTP cyclohydrolase II
MTFRCSVEAFVADFKNILVPKESFGQISVERCIAELRAGRPVLVTSGGGSAIVMSVEALNAQSAARLDELAAGRARLLLPAPRLRRLGLERSEAGALALPRIDLARISALSFGVEAHIDAPVAALTALGQAALELARIALVLPALLFIEVDSEEAAKAALVGVDAAAILDYRAARAEDIHILSRAPVPLEGAPDTEFIVFRGGEGLRDQVAVIVGHPDPAKPVTVRLHSACLTGDLFGSLKCDCGDQLRHTARYMAEHDGGVLLYLDQEGRGNGLANKIRAYHLQAEGFDTYDADEVLGFGHDQRHFDFAGAMLKQLGITRVRLMTNNPAKIVALETAGLEVVSAQRILGRNTDQNVRYLASKRDRAGHLIEIEPPPAHSSSKE